MELDVHLSRTGDESWGFRLIGGKDFSIPLTVVKVVPESPAEIAGLQNGDAVCRINNSDTQGLSHDSAKHVVDSASDTLLMTVNRGLYDPVLDDYEPMYEPIDQEDFDQPSQPSEVDPFQIQQFIDTKAPDNLLELKDIEVPGLAETRSLTASPFVLPTKPYRPFSTEPLVEVPPLEDPIILNPNYKDEFRDSEDRDLLPETKFKLPISGQYDPDGTRRNSSKVTVSKCKEIRSTEDIVKKETFEERVKEETNSLKDMQHQMMVDEIIFMEKMKKEIDLDRIEKTAVNLVDESIERAVAVAGEIKEAIDLEMSQNIAFSEVKEYQETTSQSKKESIELSTKNKTISKDDMQVGVEANGVSHELSKFNETKYEVNVSKDVKKLETLNKQELVDHKSKQNGIQEIEDTTVARNVRRISEAAQESASKQNFRDTSVQKSDVNSVTSEAVGLKMNVNKTNKSTKESSSSSQTTKTSDAKKTTVKERAYTFGLQTIPNIKGCVHSSYHYNLLLHTFFIHLTDVMVALSRFLLTQSVFDKDEKETVTNETVTEHITVNDSVLEEITEEQSTIDKTEQEVIKTDVEVSETSLRRSLENQTENNTEKYLGLEETVERHKLSGAKMAQVVERKSEEVTQRMDAVISEFQVKAGIEDSVGNRQRRSRSRSRIEEEVALESDPLEWLSKADNKQSVEISETKSQKSTSYSEFNQAKTNLRNYEKSEKKSSNTKEGKQMYVAIVDSHVFTNKDAIFDEQVSEFSETSSVQSADEINVAIKACETVATEKVILEREDVKQEIAKSIVGESQELVVENVKCENVEIAEQAHTIIKEIREQEKTVNESNFRSEVVANEISDQIVVAEEVKHAINVVEQEKEEYTATSFDTFQAINTTQNIQEEKTKEIELIQHEFSPSVVMESHESHSELVETSDEVHAIVEEAQEQFQATNATENIQAEETKETELIQHEFSHSVVMESHESHSETVKTIEEVHAIVEEVQEQEETAIETITKNDVIIQDITEPVTGVQEITKFTINDTAITANIKVEEYSAATCENVEVVETTNEIPSKNEKREAKVVTFNEVAELTSEIEIQEPAKKEEPIDELCTELSIVAKPGPTLEEASAELKIVKEQIFEIEQTLQLSDKSETFINKHSEIMELENQYAAFTKNTMQIYESKEMIQESSITANSLENRKRLTLDLNSAKHGKYSSQSSIVSPLSTIDTPTPSTIPPTPLTDEYVFKIKHHLPKSRGSTPAPMDATPEERIEECVEDEDPHIVKKKLVAHIDTTLDSPIIYDPPLPSPPFDKPITPVYTKPGLRGGSDRSTYRREEILEIERKSSLLASAIDETIKCIEEYKEEVGIKTKDEVEKRVSTENVQEMDKKKDETGLESEFIIYNGFSKVEINGHDDTKINDEWSKIDKQLKDSNEELSVLSENIVNRKENSNAKLVPDAENEAPNEITETENSNKTNGDLYKEILNSGLRETVVDASINHIVKELEIKHDPLEGYRPVQFNPEELKAIRRNLQPVYLGVQEPTQRESSPSYVDASGQILGTIHGIVDGLDNPVVDSEEAKELGKPGITEEKIAELISGESEMLREAHVMGLTRVLSTHMHRPDDSSVDFKRIKPIIESLKDSEVLKALNDELIRTREEKKKQEEKKWTTFLQKPKRPVPKAKFGYYGYMEQEEEVESPYKVKIVKQPKPKVAPDYKAEDFETGPLPWEERALKEPPPPPVDAEDPILIPEEVPEFFEAVDPLPESEIPDLEETGIPLPPPNSEEEHPVEEKEVEDSAEEQPVELDIEAVVEDTEKIVEEMEQNRLAEQLLSGVQNMVDPNASIEQQLAQMRAQVAALAQLPGVIQQTLNLVTQQLTQLSQQESNTTTIATVETQEIQENTPECEEEPKTNGVTIVECTEEVQPTINEEPEPAEETKPSLTKEEMEKLKKEEEEMLEEQRRIEKQKKELMEQMRLEQESRQVKQRLTPRVGKPRPVFGPPVPQARPLVLPGGRKWRKPEDAYNEQFIAETLSAQAELLQGKTKGINFMKYEKPPVSLDHLQQSETYKLIHNMEQTPARRVEMLTPVIAEADYREKCRSVTPSNNHMTYPQQVHP